MSLYYKTFFCEFMNGSDVNIQNQNKFKIVAFSSGVFVIRHFVVKILPKWSTNKYMLISISAIPHTN